MPVTPIITFRGARRSAAMVKAIEERVDALGRVHARITSCRVLVEFGESRHTNGNRYHVRIDLAVPGGEIVVGDQPSTRRLALGAGKERPTKVDEAATDEKYLRTALQHAFSVTRRRLQDFTRKQRGDVKTHGARRRAAKA